MRCLHCGKRVPLLRKTADGDFCCDAHRKRHFEITRVVLTRLGDEPPLPRAPASGSVIKEALAVGIAQVPEGRTQNVAPSPTDFSFSIVLRFGTQKLLPFDDRPAESIPESAGFLRMEGVVPVMAEHSGPKLVPREAQFPVAASAMFPILRTLHAAQPQSPRIPESTFCTPGPLAAPPGEAKPAKGLDQVDVLSAEPRFGSRGLVAADIARTLAEPGFCSEGTPAMRQIAAVALMPPAREGYVGLTAKPALSIPEAEQPESPRLLQCNLGTLDPVVASRGELQSSKDLTQLNFSPAKPGLGSQRLIIACAASTLAKPGLSSTEMPPPRKMAAVALKAPAGGDSIGLTPKLICPAPGPEKTQPTRPQGDPVELWVSPIDDDATPVTGAVWFEQEVAVALPAISITDPRMIGCGRFYPFCPACFNLGFRERAPVGEFAPEWPVSSPLLPRGETLPTITFIRL